MDELIEILIDRTASASERDDAAMDLADYDDALDVLISVASDPTDSWIVLGACGTSIAEIWRRLGIYDETLVARLAPMAQGEIRASFSD